MRSWKIGKYRVIDLINPYKWRAVIQGYLFDKYVGLHFCEQVVYRSVLCKPCRDAGECLHCGCATPAHFLAPDNFCSQGHWQFIIEDPEQWEIYKETLGIDFKIEYNGINAGGETSPSS